MSSTGSIRSGRSELFLRYSFYLLLLTAVVIAVMGVGFLAIPLFFSIVIYYILGGIVDYAESYHVPRALTIVVLFLLIGTVVFIALSSIVSPVVKELEPLFSNWTQDMKERQYKYLNLNIAISLNEEQVKWQKVVKPEELLNTVLDYAFGVVEGFINFVPSLASYFLLTPLISFFFLLEGHLIYKSMIRFIPNRYFEMSLMIFYKVNEQVKNYLKSLVIQGGIMSTVVGIGFFFIGLDHFIAFAVFVGIANSIPYLGPLIGAIPPIAFAILTPEASPEILYIAGVVLVGQLVDNIFTQPAIIAKSVSLHPLVVLAGIAVCGNFFGLVGMFIAIPMVSILKVCITILFQSLRDHKII